MMRWMQLGAWCALALGLSAQQRDFQIEAASKRKALLIGNNAYGKQALNNAVNDATDLNKSLQGLGFNTRLLVDADLRTMDLAIREFAQGLNAGDFALFYFSGHGMNIEGENFLLPVSFQAEMEADVRYQALSASRVRDLLRGRNVRLSILILDACRSNPFRAIRASSGGLSGMSGAGAFIAFAADEGKTADDNPKERNGLFTKHLLRELGQPGLGLEQLFTRVRTAVYEESQGKQIPFSYSGLLGEFVFRPAPPAPPTATYAEPRPLPPSAAPSAAPPVVPNAAARVLPSFGEKRMLDRDGLRYIYVPPGRSLIGCYPADTCQPGDLTGREVQSSTGFWMGETEVTRDAYLKVMNTVPPLRLEAHKRLAVVMQGRLPVADINAQEAATYCRRVGLRLPTEFEWEFAARAGMAQSQPPQLGDYAWIAPEAGYPRAVAQKQPNLWGLYDMLGNLGEYTLATNDQTKISVRGGSMIQTADRVRFARRYELPDPTVPYMNFGFRCAGPEFPSVQGRQ